MNGYQIASRELAQQFNTIAVLRQEVERLEEKNMQVREQATSQ